MPLLLYSLVKDHKNISNEKYLENFSSTLIDLQTNAYLNIWDKKIKTYQKALLDRRQIQTFNINDQVIY